MRSRLRHQGKLSQQKKPQTSIKNITSQQLHTKSLNNMSINNATNNQLKDIIEKLIVKSRSLITSLQKTLKQLDEVRCQKDFWKNHYLNFKNACQKYIKSRGIAPFQYINSLQKTLTNCSPQKVQAPSDSQYRSFSLNNLNKTFNQFYSKSNKSPFKDLKFQQSINHNEITKIDLCSKDISQYKHQQVSILKTVSKTVDETQVHDRTQFTPTPKNDCSFKGIKLGGKNKKQQTISPIKLSIYDTKSKNNSNYRRKDSLETKRVQLFSFVRHKNQQLPQNSQGKTN